MRAKTMGLAWITVNDFKKAIQFYTEVVGLKLLEINEEWGWAELEGHEGGARLGIAQHQPSGCQNPVQAGQNAVLSFTVDDVDQARKDLEKQGATLIGPVEEVPGHVKMQLLRDTEGNYLNVVQVLEMETHHKEHHSGGCCGGHH